MTNRNIQYWVIPPDSNAEFVACMEDVLEIYEKLYNPAIPVVCMDEQPVQLVKHVRAPIAATQEHPQRVDYEYERARLCQKTPIFCKLQTCFLTKPSVANIFKATSKNPFCTSAAFIACDFVEKTTVRA